VFPILVAMRQWNEDRRSSREIAPSLVDKEKAAGSQARTLFPRWRLPDGGGHRAQTAIGFEAVGRVSALGRGTTASARTWPSRDAKLG